MSLHIDLDPGLRVSVSTQCRDCTDFSPLKTDGPDAPGGNLFNVRRVEDHSKKTGHTIFLAITPTVPVVSREEPHQQGSC